MSLLARAIALHREGRPAEAEALYRQVLATTPNDSAALHLLGVTLHQQGRSEEAVASIERALAIDANDAAAHSNLSLALRDLKRFDEALASLDRAIAIAPGLAQSWNNRGNVLRAMKRDREALESYDRAIACKPDHALAHRNRADVLLDLNRPREALDAIDRALRTRADDAQSWNLRGVALGDLGDHVGALASFERALALEPGLAEARFNRGSALIDLRRYADAADALCGLAEAAPRHPFVRGQALHAKMLACEWHGLEAFAASVLNDVREGRPSAEPFGLQAIATSPADLARCAQIFSALRFPAAPAVWKGERYGHDRIRIGYVSGEFREQATAILTARLYELHDRTRFSLHAFDNGTTDDSPLRRRIENAFDEVVPIASISDDTAAQRVREREIDILVDLNGYFGRFRQGLFARRPAPVQVNYLGFPGTLGSRCYDYLIADRHVIPAADDRHYVERIVRLPDTYQPNDPTRAIASEGPSRREAGLPDDAFVFCCFNNNYKITPHVFAVWLRLLREIEGSVLWLLEDNADAVGNLRRACVQHGVDARRLVFAPRVPPDAHLARHRLADLFVDTLPYGAHTTASDALWAGLPLVTVHGTTFPGRVAAGLLHAADLPELITRDLDHYAALSLALARDPSRLRALRDRLVSHRHRCPLFDTDRHRRHLESAFATMHRRSEEGAPPVSFDVAPQR